MIDFKRRKFDVPATVERLEYDPNRTAFIALLKYKDGELSYILAPQRLNEGDKVVSGDKVDVKPGNAMPMANMPDRHHHPQCGDEARQGRPDRAFGRHLCPARRPRPGLWRSSGSTPAKCAWCRPNAWRRSARFRTPTIRTIVIGKAGRNRWLGRRPHVRGVAMNPVDHPHGGGEGRTSGGRHPVTPWGKGTKGTRTRKNQKTDKYIVRARHVKKK